MARIIKRYSNRKLYDTEDKRYITLEQIQQLVKDGQDIKVVENQTGEDLTTVTLSQLLLEQEKAEAERLRQSVLDSPLVKAAFEAFPDAELTAFIVDEQRSA